MPCRNYAPCICLRISASSWKALRRLVRSCDPLEHLGLLRGILSFPGFSWIVLRLPGWLCRSLEKLAFLEASIGPSGSKRTGREKNTRSANILLVSKTDNPFVSTRTPSNNERRAEWWKLILLTRPRDAYPHFLASRVEIEALLRAGHTMHRVWEAYRQASPPFPATYETFRTYCVKLGLSKLRNGPILGPPDVGRTEAAPPSTKARPYPTVWPRVAGKPREFVPRTEDD